MKCIAEKRCRRVADSGVFKGKAIVFGPGDVFDFDECPDGFRPVQLDIDGKEEIDFDTASEDELQVLDYELQDLKDYMRKKHPSVTFSPKIGRKRLIEKLIYARDHDLDAVDLD